MVSFKEMDIRGVIFIILSVKIRFKNWIFMKMARAQNAQMATGCHSNGSANFEENALIIQRAI